jgi:hypothetical protein
MQRYRLAPSHRPREACEHSAATVDILTVAVAVLDGVLEWVSQASRKAAASGAIRHVCTRLPLWGLPCAQGGLARPHRWASPPGLAPIALRAYN